jgi:hypothetical protein
MKFLTFSLALPVRFWLYTATRQERAVPQAHRHIQGVRPARAVAATRDRTPAATPAAALTTLILGVLLTLLAQAGWMTLT